MKRKASVPSERKKRPGRWEMKGPRRYRCRRRCEMPCCLLVVGRLKPEEGTYSEGVDYRGSVELDGVVEAGAEEGVSLGAVGTAAHGCTRALCEVPGERRASSEAERHQSVC